MGKNPQRFCCKAIKSEGWRIWDRKMKRWRGQIVKEFPSKTLDKLNKTGKF